MSSVSLDILRGLPSVACLPVVWVLFGNPRELGVKEARALVAKRAARVVFWYAAAPPLVDWGRLMRIAGDGEGRGWVFAVLPIATAAASAAYAIRLSRTHPAILETASDDLVLRWKRRFFAGTELAVYAGFVAVCLAVRLL